MLSEDAETLKLTEAIQNIQEWLTTEPNLNARNDEHMIIRFLQGCKFNMERTKIKMKNFYEMKTKYPEWFANRDPLAPNLYELLKLGVFIPLPKRDEEGRHIIVARASINNPKKNPMVDVFKVGIMIIDLAMEVDDTIAKSGVCVIIDLKDVSLSHALQMTPTLIKKAVHAWQDCYPIKIKSMDFVNCPGHVNVILSIFRKFMREKLRRRIRVHGMDLSGLHKCVDPALLPEEYGGSDGTIETYNNRWKELTVGRRQWFLDDEKYKAKLN